jgi:hypothetical protein
VSFWASLGAAGQIALQVMDGQFNNGDADNPYIRHFNVLPQFGLNPTVQSDWSEVSVLVGVGARKVSLNLQISSQAGGVLLLDNLRVLKVAKSDAVTALPYATIEPAKHRHNQPQIGRQPMNCQRVLATEMIFSDTLQLLHVIVGSTFRVTIR